MTPQMITELHNLQLGGVLIDFQNGTTVLRKLNQLADAGGLNSRQPSLHPPLIIDFRKYAVFKPSRAFIH